MSQYGYSYPLSNDVRINISLQDGVPIYRQIEHQVKYLIASGQLAADEELPPIRALAQQLSVTPNTVVKAYGELQATGLVYKRPGAGTFVSDTKSPLASREKKRILTQRADALLADAAQLGISFADVLEVIHKRHAVLEEKQAKGAKA